MSRSEPALDATAAAPVFSALGDATRLAIVARLGPGRPLSVRELTEGAGLTRQGVSKHLRVLRTAGLVASERVGRETQFVLHPGGLDGARHYLEQVAGQWDAAIGRLRSLVEEEEE